MDSGHILKIQPTIFGWQKMSIFIRLQEFAISRKPNASTFAKERIYPYTSHNINSDFDTSGLFKSRICLYYFNSPLEVNTGVIMKELHLLRALPG